MGSTKVERAESQPLAPLAVSVGDPAGIGPLIAVSAAKSAVSVDQIVLFGDAPYLMDKLREARAPCALLPADDWSSLRKGSVGVVSAGRWPFEIRGMHQPTAEGGLAQLQCLDAALDAVLAGRARALVTGPISKAAVTLSGTRFTGHTEYLAERASLKRDSVTMMFLGDSLNVGLVTTHEPISNVPSQVTEPRVVRTIQHLHAALSRVGRYRRTLRIDVTGLNPHAGESGLLGDEEAVVRSAIATVRSRLRPGGDLELTGPTPAETSFRNAQRGDVDGVVAMFHDQATIASKLLDFGSSVNVTWGLPYIRTSVDHGVAYEAAREGAADDSGMRSALLLARRLTMV